MCFELKRIMTTLVIVRSFLRNNKYSLPKVLPSLLFHDQMPSLLQPLVDVLHMLQPPLCNHLWHGSIELFTVFAFKGRYQETEDLSLLVHDCGEVLYEKEGWK
jgi:hypothetical protein